MRSLCCTIFTVVRQSVLAATGLRPSMPSLTSGLDFTEIWRNFSSSGLPLGAFERCALCPTRQCLAPRSRGLRHSKYSLSDFIEKLMQNLYRLVLSAIARWQNGSKRQMCGITEILVSRDSLPLLHLKKRYFKR